MKNGLGETPLLSIRHLLDQSRYADALAAAQLLLCHHHNSVGSGSINVNERDGFSDQSLLSFSVVHGDAALGLTRFLLNSGARVFNDPTPHSLSRRLDGSAFRYFDTDHT